MIQFVVTFNLTNGRTEQLEIEANNPEQAEQFGVRTMRDIIKRRRMQCKIANVHAEMLEAPAWC